MYELIKRAKNGEKEAFGELLVQYKSDLYKVAKAKLKNDDDIADVFQETAYRAYKSINKLKNEEYFRTWITKILINNCNAFYKSKKQIKEVSLEEVDETSLAPVIDTISGDSEFENMIELLNSKEKLIITLHYSKKYTIKEISEIMEINENTIKTKIHRAKKKLEEIWLKNKEDVEIWTN